MSGFFSKVQNNWGEYSSLRSEYAKAIPLPSKKYFDAIESLGELAHLLVRPIHSPLWLGINCFLFLLKSAMALIATALLLVPALLFTICAPKSSLSENTNSAFTWAAAHTVAAAGMSIVAACAAVLSLIFNPIYLICRGLGTLASAVNSITDSCCGCKMG